MDVTKCDCQESCGEFHQVGARVTVTFSGTDEKYYGNVRKSGVVTKVTVQLDDGNTVECRREEVYGPREVVPETVMERLKISAT